MARHTGGWICLHRSIQTSEIGRDMAAAWIFINLVMWANIEDGRFDGKPLLRGQLVTGEKEIADKLGIHISTVHRKVHKLINLKMLNRELNKVGSIITIVNYGKFQDIHEHPEQEVEQNLNKVRTRVEHLWNNRTIKQENKENINTVSVEAVDPKPKTPRKAKKPAVDPGDDPNDPGLTPTKLMEIWNAHRGTLSEAKVWTAKRIEQAKLRIAEEPNPDVWVRIAKAVAGWPWGNGRDPKAGKWRASFEYFLQPDTRRKVLENVIRNYMVETQSQPIMKLHSDDDFHPPERPAGEW